MDARNRMPGKLREQFFQEVLSSRDEDICNEKIC